MTFLRTRSDAGKRVELFLGRRIDVHQVGGAGGHGGLRTLASAAGLRSTLGHANARNQREGEQHYQST
jgi:hypothetical protein